MLGFVKIVAKISAGIALLIGVTLSLAWTSAQCEEYQYPGEYPENIGPPESLFACKTVPTEVNGKIYGCGECENDPRRNTCTSIMKDR